MIDYDKQFNDIMAQIQAQYKGSNVAQLIEGIIEIKKKGVLRAYKSLIDDCLNLSTAKGDALDLWGYILGINRFVPRDSNQDAKENFKQWNFNKSNFKHLIFLQVRDQLYHRLTDDDFRNLLLLFLQRQYIFASPREAQSLIDDYISKKYGELNIWDSQKMSIVAEFSFRDYPDWMRWYILLKDIIPRPAGVKIDIIKAPEPQSLGEGLLFTAQASSSSVTLNQTAWTSEELQLEYRTNTNTNWQNYTLGTTINLANIDDWVEMRNQGLQTTIKDKDTHQFATHQFVMTGKIAASGNIQFLLDKTGELLSVYDFCYSFLFEDCTSLTTAPELPATTLATNCYENMFQGCTSLTTAPSLPATTLANACYASMFSDCTSLTTAPELPATTLATNCYENMFQGCTSLTTAPSLPATNLAEYCYNSMFYECTSLTTAPELPATNLAKYCYDSMFYKCTSLTTAPELPATTLANACYRLMFSDCTSLTTAPELPATNLAESCYWCMFYGCANLKVNENGSGTKIFTCPSTSGLIQPVIQMFDRTGGSFTGYPTTGNTYNWYN